MTEEEVASQSDYLKNNSNISSRILSKDGDYINIVLRPKSDQDFPGLVAAVSNITTSYQNQYEFHFGGQPHLTGAIPELIKTETQQLMLLGLFIMAAILLINLRSPLTVSFFLSSFDQFGFLLFLGIVHITIAVIVLLMMFVHKDVEDTEQANFQVMTHRPSTVAMEVIAEEAIESQTE